MPLNTQVSDNVGHSVPERSTPIEKERMTMNQYIKTNIDMLGILEALYAISKDRWERWGKQYSVNPAWAVQDSKTIGIHVGRQCGATRASLQWIRKHSGQCIYIAKDVRLLEANLAHYIELEGGKAEDYIRLPMRCVPDVTESWTSSLTPDQVDSTRFIILDDSTFLFNGSSLKRVTFNKWVAETFHPDTFVILIK